MSEFGKTLSSVNFHVALWSLLSEVKTSTADFSKEEWMATILLLCIQSKTERGYAGWQVDKTTWILTFLLYEGIVFSL